MKSIYKAIRTFLSDQKKLAKLQPAQPGVPFSPAVAALLPFERRNRGHQDELDIGGLGIGGDRSTHTSQLLRMRRETLSDTTEALLDAVEQLSAGEINGTPGLREVMSAPDTTGCLLSFVMRNLERFLRHNRTFPFEGMRLNRVACFRANGSLELTATFGLERVQVFAERKWTYTIPADVTLGTCWALLKAAKRTVQADLTSNVWPEFDIKNQNTWFLRDTRDQLTQHFRRCTPAERKLVEENWVALMPYNLK